MNYRIPIIMLLMLSLCMPVFAATTTYEYDELNRVTTVTLENGQQILYDYDKIGNMRSKTSSGNGAIISYGARIEQDIPGDAPTYFTSLQEAYDNAKDGAVIQLKTQTFNENFIAHRNITVTIDGGYTSDYASNPNMTSLRGSMTLNSGTVVIQNFQVLE